MVHPFGVCGKVIPWRGERRLEPTSILGALGNQHGLDGNGTGNRWTVVCPRSISFGYGHPEGEVWVRGGTRPSDYLV